MKAAFALALLSLAAAGQAADPAKFMSAKLVAETSLPKPGTAVLLGFRMSPQPGWHGYWSNPGDSGIAPTVRWRLPPGVSAGPLLHPAPELLFANGVSSFVHTGPHTLLARIRLAPNVPAGTQLPVTADLSWAACTESQCVPLHQTFTIDLVAGSGTPGPDAVALKGAAARLPREGPSGTFLSRGKELRLVLPRGLQLNPSRTRFFPDENGMFPAAAARVTMEDGAISIVAPAGTAQGSGKLRGVVSDGDAAYHLSFTPAPVGEPVPAQSNSKADAPAVDDTLVPVRGISNPASVTTQPAARQRDKRNWEWLWLIFAGGAILVAAAVAMRRKT